ncbi:MAG: hypothetical protein ACFBSG_04995 [Leptolyngbyaceae cyanobacterium]
MFGKIDNAWPIRFGNSWLQGMLLVGAMVLGHGSTGWAAPLAEINLGGNDLTNQELVAGPVRILITEFQARDYRTDETAYLAYELYINGEFQTAVRQEVDFLFGNLAIEHLDPDDVPEVIFHRYTGGAHCCSIYTIYSLQGDRLHRTITYPLDAAAAGSFEDLDGDGYREFFSADQRFLYAFGSYASSRPPIVFLSFQGGSLVDVTRQFPEEMRSSAFSMYTQTKDSTLADPLPGANSVLAGYVAQKILLDEYDAGWEYMLAHYDPTDTWGLVEYNTSGEEVGRFPDYPTALEAFLIDLEYLTVNGEPNPNLDLSRILVEQESVL